MKIKYAFNNGDVTEVEVSEEVGAVIIEAERTESNADRNYRRHFLSMDAFTYEGVEIADHRTPEAAFIRQLDNQRIKNALAKLTPTQRRRLLMLIDGMTYEEIARCEGTVKSSIHESIEAAKKAFRKNY